LEIQVATPAACTIRTPHLGTETDTVEVGVWRRML
jgi:hypothetical protein